MGYVTYDYYKSIYGEDSMPETDFNRLSWEACLPEPLNIVLRSHKPDF